MYSQTSSRTSFAEAGYAILEVTFAALVAMVLLAGFGTFYLAQQHRLQEQQARLEMLQNARAAIDTMIRELRSAGRNPHAVDRLAGITVADARQVQFTLDLDGDGTVGGSDELRGFRQQGAELQMQTRNGLAGWMPVVDGVSNLAFEYYPKTANLSDPTTMPLGRTPTADELASIKTIRIRLTVQKSVGGRTISQTEVGTADLRNVLTEG
ncbi:MAG: hypothetical protein QOD06_2586 [Candidatus Binatota bacterium]|nr:hypothetical protein [Candidatus Binatota bacterium]